MSRYLHDDDMASDRVMIIPTFFFGLAKLKIETGNEKMITVKQTFVK